MVLEQNQEPALSGVSMTTVVIVGTIATVVILAVYVWDHIDRKPPW